MGDTGNRYCKDLKPTGKGLVLALVGHLKDPDTGERLIDDPNFRAAMGLKDTQKKSEVA